jgi:ATP-dependent Lhr-like helicase
VDDLGFHPLVRRWFEDAFRAPTSVQREGWRSISSGRDTLIAAPTGSGKTLAAFLWSLDEIVREASTHRLRLAAQSPRQRYREEPCRAARRHP